MQITNYVKSGYSLLAVETFEIKRAMESIKVEKPFNLFKWNILEGILNLEDGTKYTNFAELFDFMNKKENSVFLLENFNMFFQQEEILQFVLNNYPVFKKRQVMMVIVGSEIKFPPQLEKIITKLDFDLPKKEAFREAMKDMIDLLKESGTDVEYNESVADACLGLSYEEGENALALSLVENNGKFDKQSVLRIKGEMIKKTGFMKYFDPEPEENIGGMYYAREYAKARLQAWTDPNKPKLKAIFLLGIQGAGKSLFAKVLASVFNWPGIIADVGAFKGKYVGETEQNWRKFTKTVDAIGKCIILCDEIEKIFSGGTGEMTNSVDAGQLGYFLTWSQERKSEAIIIATANDISNLPPEFLRAERWDTIFFVDFPSFEERKEIVQIMNRKWKANLPLDDDFIESLDHWTGAEISQLAKDSHFEPIEQAMDNIPLIYKVKKKQIEKISEWKKVVRIANKKPEGKKEEIKGRKISVGSKSEILDTKTKSKLQLILEKRGKSK